MSFRQRIKVPSPEMYENNDLLEAAHTYLYAKVKQGATLFSAMESSLVLVRQRVLILYISTADMAALGD